MVSTASSPCKLLLAQCGKKSPQKIPSGTVRKSLAVPKNTCRVAVRAACVQLEGDDTRQFSVLSIWHLSSPYNLFRNPKQRIHNFFPWLEQKGTLSTGADLFTRRDAAHQA